MKRRVLALAAAAVGFLVSASGAMAAPVACATLSTVRLPSITVTAAEDVPAGDYTPPEGPRQVSLPAFCRVTLTVAPRIKIEIWLPKDTWNGRFRAEGGGGYAGQISYGGLAQGIRGGYATASTDTGHPASAGGTFVLNPDGTLNTSAVTDFAERSLRELATESKAVIKAYYGSAPTYSYWNGCSTGGRQGLVAVQRFPDAYDGLVIAAPAINWDRFIAAELWPQVVMNSVAGGAISASKLTAVTKAAVAACDAGDGVADGVINDPRKCTYDPAALVCKAGESGDSCLSPKEADAVRAIWNGPTSSKGERLWFGLERGAPLGFLAGPNPFFIATTHFQAWVQQDPKADWRTLTTTNFDAYFRASQLKLHDLIATDDAKLDAFRKRGGKMIIWHGEADQLIFPRGTINYYERLLAENGGPKEVAQFARLFLAPGVGHCGGGDGPAPFGAFEAVVNWVEKGVAPPVLPAIRRREDGSMLSRPLCPYPLTAKWKGTGSTDQAANFSCVDGQHQKSDFAVAPPARK
jgi:pimeloyl-ACP methyl ester carboxylesterase